MIALMIIGLKAVNVINGAALWCPHPPKPLKKIVGSFFITVLVFTILTSNSWFALLVGDFQDKPVKYKEQRISDFDY